MSSIVLRKPDGIGLESVFRLQMDIAANFFVGYYSDGAYHDELRMVLARPYGWLGFSCIFMFVLDPD